MITKEQATSEREFHFGECRILVGPRGGETLQCEVWRRSGRTQTWKTRPEDFRVPVKYGLYRSSEIRPYSAYEFHAASTCEPVRVESK